MARNVVKLVKSFYHIKYLCLRFLSGIVGVYLKRYLSTYLEEETLISSLLCSKCLQEKLYPFTNVVWNLDNYTIYTV